VHPFGTSSRAPRPLIADACFSPDNTLWLALGGPTNPGGLLVSRDGARTVREVTHQDPRDADAHRFYAVYALDARHVWACGAAGEDDVGVVWRSIDGGHFWEVLMAGDDARGLEADAMYTQVVFLDAAKGFLLSAGQALLVTVNGGRSWSAIDIGNAAPFGLYFLDARRGWLVSQDLDARGMPTRTRFLGTHDGGTTWHDEAHDFAGRPCIDVAGLYVDTRGVATLCGPDGALLTAQLSDGAHATRWRFARGAIPVDLNAIARAPDGALWVVGEGGTMLRSRDDGRSYIEVPTGTRRDLHTIAFARDTTGDTYGFACGDRGVMLRFDATRSETALRLMPPLALTTSRSHAREASGNG
jgi:photosystem II stability/assembly factor-like uncharacterized protein